MVRIIFTWSEMVQLNSFNPGSLVFTFQFQPFAEMNNVNNTA